MQTDKYLVMQTDKGLVIQTDKDLVMQTDKGLVIQTDRLRPGHADGQTRALWKPALPVWQTAPL